MLVILTNVSYLGLMKIIRVDVGSLTDKDFIILCSSAVLVNPEPETNLLVLSFFTDKQCKMEHWRCFFLTGSTGFQTSELYTNSLLIDRDQLHVDSTVKVNHFSRLEKSC